MDRRARFFILSAIACAILLWPCPEEFRWVGITLTIAFGTFALLSFTDHVVRKRRS